MTYKVIGTILAIIGGLALLGALMDPNGDEFAPYAITSLVSGVLLFPIGSAMEDIGAIRKMMEEDRKPKEVA